MRMVGLRGSVFWYGVISPFRPNFHYWRKFLLLFFLRLSWLAVYSLMVFVVTVIATIIVYFVVLDTQNVGTLFLLFFLIFEFGISMIMFAFIFTTLFSNAKVRKKKGENRFISYFSSPFCCTIMLFVSGCGWCWRTGYYHGCLFLLHSSLCWRSSNSYFLGSIFVVSTCFRHGNWQSKYRRPMQN